MKGFNFEKNLNHQSHAVDSTNAVFENISLVQPTEADKNYINPAFDFLSDWAYPQNLRAVQESNDIDEKIKRNSNIIDIMMETGTGKTYTYTKTIFELNKNYGIFKFIIVVPTLSIKAGTIDFLKSDSSREHFKEQYGKTLHLHIVESQKNSKSKKSYIPPAVSSFVNAGNFEKNSIQVMIINAGMINSETMQKSFDKGLFDKYTVPFDAVAATKPFMIIDEPHKFGQGNKTWENIQKMKPQFILRYGATFPDKEISVRNVLTGKPEKQTTKDYHNLIYQLTAIDSFNNNLVKGVIGHITEFNAGENAIVKFIDSDGTEASFELIENDKRKTVTVSLFGSQFLTWRGIPLIPSNKLNITGGKTNILLLRTGESRQGVVGLYQPNLPGQQGMGLSVRFMGINHKAIASYLVSLYCSLAVLTEDALGVLEDVEVGQYHEYK